MLLLLNFTQIYQLFSSLTAAEAAAEKQLAE